MTGRSAAMILAFGAALGACKPAPAPTPPPPRGEGAWAPIAAVALVTSVPDPQGSGNLCVVTDSPVVATRPNGDVVAAWWATASEGRLAGAGGSARAAAAPTAYGARAPRQFPRTLAWSMKHAGVWNAPSTLAGFSNVSYDPRPLQLTVGGDGALALIIPLAANSETPAVTYVLTWGPQEADWMYPIPVEAGGPQQAEPTYHSPEEPGRLQDVRVSPAGANDLLLVGVASGGAVQLARRTPPEGWSPPETLAASGAHPSLAAAADGAVVAVWKDNTATAQSHPYSFDILWRLRAPGAAAWSPPQRLGPLVIGAWPPAVAAAGQAFFIAYQDDKTHGVSVATLDRAGGPAKFVAVTRGGNLPSDVVLTARPDGSLVLAWSDYEGASGQRSAHFALRSPQGDWRVAAPLDAFPATAETTLPGLTVLASAPAGGACPTFGEMAWRP